LACTPHARSDTANATPQPPEGVSQRSANRRPRVRGVLRFAGATTASHTALARHRAPDATALPSRRLRRLGVGYLGGSAAFGGSAYTRRYSDQASMTRLT